MALNYLYFHNSIYRLHNSFIPGLGLLWLTAPDAVPHIHKYFKTVNQTFPSVIFNSKSQTEDRGSLLCGDQNFSWLLKSQCGKTE